MAQMKRHPYESKTRWGVEDQESPGSALAGGGGYTQEQLNATVDPPSIEGWFGPNTLDFDGTFCDVV